MLSLPLAICDVAGDSINEAGYFSIVQISDTQHLSYGYPESWQSLVDWIISNQDTYNIKMVIHTGDIVDNGYGIPQQWLNANSSMGCLLDADIPYTWNAGNHDQNMSNGNYAGTPDGEWYGSNYLSFNSTYLRTKPYWVSDINYGKNTAVQFSFGAQKFLIINLEFHANQTAIDWMIDLINNYQNYNVIVATHSFLNGLQGYGYPYSVNSPQWENQLFSILASYPNVFLTMSGHYIHTKYPAGDEETSNYTQVGTREDTFINRQMALGDLGKGANSIRIFTFDMENDLVNVKTLDIETNCWKTDIWNQFSFNFTPVKEISPVFMTGSVSTVQPTMIPSASSPYANTESTIESNHTNNDKTAVPKINSTSTNVMSISQSVDKSNTPEQYVFVLLLKIIIWFLVNLLVLYYV
jgi:hypothetical protein